ncbi:MAG: Ycf48-like protein [Ignavibacteria bacterium]|nr:Ycf48-like protein [Ignavibacteria bacterium]
MNETTGWAVGDSGLILKTTNGGENWISSLAGNKPLRAFHFFDENTGVIVGGNTGTFYTGTSRLVIKTTNGGVNWHTIMNSTDVPFRNIQFVNDSVGLIGVNGVLKTTNKGDTWQYYGGINSEYCFFLNENTGYATSGSFPMIYKTTNGGINWSIIYYTGMFNFSGGVFFCNLNTG